MQKSRKRKVCLLRGGSEHLPGAVRGIWTSMYITRHPISKMERSYLGPCTMLFLDRMGAKRPLVRWNWKWRGQSSQSELVLQILVRGSREARRCCSAIVCLFSALQGSPEKDQRCKAQRTTGWKTSVCVRYVLYQTSATSPDSHLPAQLDVQLSHTEALLHAKGAERDTMHAAISAGWKSQHHSPNAADRNCRKISTTPP